MHRRKSEVAKTPRENVELEGARDDVSELAVSGKATTSTALGDQKAEEVVKLVHLATQETITVHAGPLPSPATLDQYERVVPGLADRIVSMAESEASHTRRLQSAGQYSGIVIVLVTLALVFFEKSGAPAVAMTALVSLAGIFVFARLRVRRDRVAGLPSSEEPHR